MSKWELRVSQKEIHRTHVVQLTMEGRETVGRGAKLSGISLAEDQKVHRGLQVPGRLRQNLEAAGEDDHSSSVDQTRRRIALPVYCRGGMKCLTPVALLDRRLLGMRFKKTSGQGEAAKISPLQPFEFRQAICGQGIPKEEAALLWPDCNG